jgi:hypothetical protein
LTLIPRPPHSTASVRVNPISPCFVVLYAARSATPCNPATDAMLTTLPEPWSSMILPSACVSRNGPVRLTAMIRSHCSRLVSSNGTMPAIPALLTSTSTRPYVPWT